MFYLRSLKRPLIKIVIVLFVIKTFNFIINSANSLMAVSGIIGSILVVYKLRLRMKALGDQKLL